MATHNEPQSYGSQDDWTSGETGQNVNNPKSERAPEAIEGDGGSVSPVQFADTESAPLMQHGVQHGGDDQPVQRVTSVATGAKRESFFKDRDYKG
ncbi:MAG TPA: hypothetical protein VH087_14245 [Thermoanaerobaculia bacterium]|jgi:hypothetical protein|nr:hypothetical protein [Thermoanaerobaculia bacterium]